jgi:hypothetical protein
MEASTRIVIRPAIDSASCNAFAILLRQRAAG